MSSFYPTILETETEPKKRKNKEMYIVTKVCLGIFGFYEYELCPTF